MSLREVVMFPRSIVPLFVGREASVKAIEKALASYDKKIFLVAQRSPEKEKPEPHDLFETGCVSKILPLLRLPDGTIKVLFEGLHRGVLRVEPEIDAREEEFPLVTVTPLPDKALESAESEALVRATHESLEEYGKINKKIAAETIMAISSLTDPGRLADAVMPHLKVDYIKKQSLLEETDPITRLEETYTLLQGEIEISSLEKKIKSRVKNQMESNQKEYYLNEQMKAINKEMGREDDPQQEVSELEKQIQAKNMPEEAMEKALRECKKLKQIPPSSAEYTVVRNYVDWVLDLPWNIVKPTELDIEQAKEILDRDHYGLDKPKKRILEYLAVQSLVDTLKGPILCLVGPPGVGKTSLSKSIARATGREFVRLSLGGVRDEAEIRGHRRTYVGALPGKIIQSLKRVEFNNPVFCLDEVDKMSMDFRGDPSSALLEVLDPEQNYSSNDHYLDLDYDLSEILFITTANTLPDIPLPLQDRMEIIRLPGYTELEKYNIAKEFLVPKQIAANGLKEENISFSKAAIYTIIQRYTREAGVRNLEREISSICRKTARKVVNQESDKKHVISANTITKLLGPPPFKISQIEEADQVGLVTGLAWTQVGGELLCVETLTMPGKGKVNVTGKLGDVMKESAQAAVSFVRSRAQKLGIDNDFYKTLDLHIHIPEGAIPKDGPSAGITMCTSLVSALTQRAVRRDVAMTGEITLRGRVLPIGGLKEKLLAAHRGGIRKVVIPKENEKDLKDIPKVVLRQMEIVPVEHMDEVLGHALVLGQGERLFANDDMPIGVEKSGAEQANISIN
jgi:ATP-dependent Lon protease